MTRVQLRLIGEEDAVRRLSAALIDASGGSNSGPSFRPARSGDGTRAYLSVDVTEDDVVAELGQGRGQRGGHHFWAVAVRKTDGPYGVHPFRYARASEGLRSVGAAAKWIVAQLEEAAAAAAAEGGEVR